MKFINDNISNTKGLVMEGKKGTGYFFITKSSQSPFYITFNGANPTLPSFRRVLFEPLQNAGNNIPDFADSRW
jgi:hypothetical protein